LHVNFVILTTAQPTFRRSRSTCGCRRSNMAEAIHTRGRDRKFSAQDVERDRLQRTEEAIVVATGAARERGCPPWVVLGVKAVEARGIRAT
jgi:hypothetical protein